MTISYNAYVETSRGFPSPFIKLLSRWRGSIFKLMYYDLLIFLVAYYALNLSYRFWMNDHQREQFCNVVSYFSIYNTKIPVIFVLTFYVEIVTRRWANQLWKAPWPDPVAIFVSSLIRGVDERGRKMRRTVMRYINLSYIMVFQLISPKVKKRFPTYDHLIDAGVLNENEKKIIMKLDAIYPKLPKYWMPIVWASSIFTRARIEGRIRDDFALRTLNDSINNFRQGCILLLHYDTISIPLVYTQTVTLAVYIYSMASVVGSQWVSMDSNTDYTYFIHYYFPLFPTLEFFFFMGWLKVAETLICPFGEDDDDFEINSAIDRNIRVSYMIVDEMHSRHPLLIKDQYWDDVYPYELPDGGAGPPPEHSTAHMRTKSSTATVGQAISKASLFWRRRHPNTGSHRTFTDSEGSYTELFVNKLVHLFPSRDPSNATVPSLFNEEEQEQEEEEEDRQSTGITFEELREQRRRKRNERQQKKVQRIVENISDITDMPMKIRKRAQFAPEKIVEDVDVEEEDLQEDYENRNRKKDQ